MAYLHPTFMNSSDGAKNSRQNCHRSLKSTPASELLYNPHWPPINKRASVELATLSLQFNFNSSHLLRSTGQSLLNVPRMKTEFGRRTVSSKAPQI